MFSDPDILHHYRQDEHPFVKRAGDWIEAALERYTPRLTDFLDPRQAQIVKQLVNGYSGVFVRFEGGYPDAERVRAYIYPEYMEPDFSDFELTLIELESSQSFHKLKHPDFLGALLGLGMKRGKFGDILLADDRCQIIAAAEAEEFLLLHLHQVHRVSVVPVKTSFANRLQPEQPMKVISTTIASPRVDAVACSVFQIARSKIVAPIKNGRLKINWKVVDSPDEQVREGDVVSLKGFGRFKVVAFGPETRKGRRRIEVGRYL